MSGFHSSGLPVSTAGALFTGAETFVGDTNLPNGRAPQTQSYSAKQLSAIGRGPVVALTDAATIALDASKGSQFSVTLGATGRTLTVSNPSPGQEILLHVKQDATGSRTVTTWTNVLWAGGAAPTLTITANALDVIRLTYNDALGKFIGEVVGKAFA